MHEGIQTLVSIFMAFVREVQVEHGGFELGMAQVALDETGVHAGFEQMGGIRMSEGMDGDTCFGDVDSLFGDAEGTLNTGPTHGRGCGGTLLVIPPGGGKEPGGMTVGFPVGTEQSQRICGEGHVTVLGAFPAVDMDLEALAINVRHLQVQGFMESEAQTIDGGEVDLIVEGSSRLQEPPDLLHTKDGGETMCALSTKE
jgi:hypothetical protein